MDSEHRHELEENVLAKWLEEKIETLKPQLPFIATGVVVVVAALVGSSIYRQSAAEATGDRWRAFSLAMQGDSPSMDALKQTSLDYPDTGVAEWADITWADGKLWDASNRYLNDRTNAEAAIAEAKAVYESLTDASNSEIADRAAYGLARVLEMEGDFEAARDQYARVAGPFAPLAERRAEQLTGDRPKAEYGWLVNAGTDTATAEATRPSAEPDDIAMPSDPLAEADEDEGDLDSLLEQFAPGEDEPGDESTEEAADVATDADADSQE